jgi:hypothetical protein
MPRMMRDVSAGVLWPAADGARSAAAKSSRRMPNRTLLRGLGEALEELPELDGTEIVEPPEEILLGRLHEDPAGGPGGVAGDEMHPPSRRQFSRHILEIYPPGRLSTGEISQVASPGMIGQLERGGGHHINEYSPCHRESTPLTL